MTNFISENNNLTLDYVDLKNDMVAGYINEDYCVFKFKGNIRFFKDGIGCELSWVDYEDDIKLEFVPVLSDVDDVEYERKWIVELIATEEFKQYCEQCDEV